MLASLASCSNGVESSGGRSSGTSGFSLNGSYDLVQMTSDKNVDLNNDGVASFDLMSEIDPAVFENDNPELVITSAIIINKAENIINFSIPHPASVIVDTPGKHGTAIFERKDFGYTYTFNKNTQGLDLNTGASQNPGVYGDMSEIKYIGQNSVKSVLTKNFYDFSTANWQLLKVTCIFRKR